MDNDCDVFLCHNHADKPAVEELANRLAAVGIKPWLDRSNLRKGVTWTAEVERCLTKECKCCAVLVGPSGLGPWQEKELRVALDRQVETERQNGSFPVIPVLLPGGNLDALPAFLKGHTCVSFPRTLEDDERFDELVRAIHGLPPAPSRPASGECPYRGLEFFDVAHASFFFGREALTVRLLEKLRPSAQDQSASRFLAILGASGSGKSSLARAGLLAALERGRIEGSGKWPIVISRPGLDPCANLAIELARRAGPELDRQAAFKDRLKDRMPGDAAALHESVQLLLPADDPQSRLVILVDQFEELFTICHEEALRRAFIDNLLNAAQMPRGRTIVLLAMRADFYGMCASYPRLAEILPQSQVLVGPMTESALREAIEKPAQSVGCELEPGLVTLLLKEVADQPGSLPYLQFALRELWNKRSGRKLTSNAYHTIGGVTGALQRKADEVYSRLSAPQQLICRRIFLRLTQPGEGVEDTKRRISVNELRPTTGSMAEVEAVLFHLSEEKTRLLTGEAQNGETFVEVAHEALIRGWPQLRSWIDADRAALRTQRRLTEAANQWNDNQRDASFLYRGARLSIAQEWALAHTDELSQLESEFLKASRWHVRGQGIKIAAAAAFVLLAGLFGFLAVRHHMIERDNQTHAEGLVEELWKADIDEVPEIVRRLGAYRRWADPLLRQEDAQAAHDPKKKLLCALALLPVDESQVDGLSDDLVVVSARPFLVVRAALGPHRARLVERLWSAALDSNGKIQQRFQASCALAAWAPEDQRWAAIRSLVAGRLVTFEASALVAWREALRPAKAQLIEPLAAIYRDARQKEQARTYATETLAEFASSEPKILFDLLAEAEEFQFPPLFEKLLAHRTETVALANDELARPTPSAPGEKDKELRATRQANAAIVLLRLGAPDRVWTLLKDSSDPRVRSYVIEWLGPRGGDPQPIVRRLDVETDVTARQALLLTLGEFGDSQFPAAGRQALFDKLAALYRDEPHAGLHGTVEWLLRKWGQTARLEGLLEDLKRDERQLLAAKSTDKRQWYVNSQKQTYVIIDGGEFSMGSPEGEPDHQPDEAQHRVRLGRWFAIAAHEVTKREFDRFLNERPRLTRINTADWVKTDDSPQVDRTWYEATEYCNWLSERERIDRSQWCYQPNSEGVYAAGMKAKEKFWELTGYRLPTEAEWEFACRAGTATSRYYGVTTTLLQRYAWYVETGANHTWPVGLLEPNEWGLVDTLGNALEWCYDAQAPYPDRPGVIYDDAPPTTPIDGTARRAVRGGAFLYLPRNVRSAYRNYYAPADRVVYIGFRPARTWR